MSSRTCVCVLCAFRTQCCSSSSSSQTLTDACVCSLHMYPCATHMRARILYLHSDYLLASERIDEQQQQEEG